jgi:myo-inositol 2-dehydrogenase / D-chiro-inositol 1-dehydrogenase
VHGDAAALAADGEIDLVAVCTPPRQHAQAALAALDAGRHVFVEKPPCLDLSEADALVQAAGASPSLVSAVGFNLRRHRQVLAAPAGDRGRPPRPAADGAHALDRRRPPARLAGEPRRGGTVLWKTGIHHLDLWRHLTGAEPRRLRSIGDDHALAVSARTDAAPCATSAAAPRAERGGCATTCHSTWTGRCGCARCDCARARGPPARWLCWRSGRPRTRPVMPSSALRRSSPEAKAADYRS